MSNPDFARAVLDAIFGILHLADGDVSEPPEDAHLPDNSGILRPLGELHRGMDIPSDTPSLVAPPLVHPDLEDHPLLGKKYWNLKGFGIRLS
jgi:hypothetical protein